MGAAKGGSAAREANTGASRKVVQEPAERRASPAARAAPTVDRVLGALFAVTQSSKLPRNATRPAGTPARRSADFRSLFAATNSEKSERRATRPTVRLVTTSAKSSRSLCGNGIKQASEECDPPDDETCDENCYWIECGDFEVQGEEECDPPSGLTCDEQCKAIPAECGDTIVQPSEQCDPPNGKSCGEDCQLTSVVNFCPSVYVFGSPSVATVGGDPITVDAVASDSDGDPLTYSWQATSGALSSATAPSILVTCTEPGPITIQVRVRDSDPNCDVTGLVIPNCVVP